MALMGGGLGFGRHPSNLSNGETIRICTSKSIMCGRGYLMRYVVGACVAALIAIPVATFVKQSFSNAAVALREANMK